MDQREKFRRYIRAARKEFETSPGGHLSEGELIDYHRGRLAEAEQERVQWHLVQCAVCIEVLKDVVDFFQSGDKREEPIPEAELDLKWEAVWQRVESQRVSAPVVPDERHIGFWHTPRAKFALAASLLVAFVLVTAWALWLRQENQQLARLQTEQESLTTRLTEVEEENGRLREQVGAIGQPGETRSAQSADLAERVKALEQENQQLQEQISAAEQQYASQLAQLRQPSLNAPIYDLLPRGSVPRSGGESEATRITIPPMARDVVVILHWDNAQEYPNYGVEIIDRAGQLVWRGGGLTPNSDGSFVITLDRTFLRKGQYRLKLYGRRGQQSQSIAEYVISVE